MYRIKEARERAKISQTKLAERLGVSKQLISLYELEKREPKLETWQKMANVLGVPVPYLQGVTSYRGSYPIGNENEFSNIYSSAQIDYMQIAKGILDSDNAPGTIPEWDVERYNKRFSIFMDVLVSTDRAVRAKIDGVAPGDDQTEKDVNHGKI